MIHLFPFHISSPPREGRCRVDEFLTPQLALFGFLCRLRESSMLGRLVLCYYGKRAEAVRAEEENQPVASALYVPFSTVL